MASNYGEKQFTRFFNDQLKMTLSDNMRRLGFPIAGREKMLGGKKFDLWFHKKRTGFVIIECEMIGWYDNHNITKVDELGLLDWGWKPRVLFFHVFSPKYSRGTMRLEEKDYCIQKAMELRKHHRNFHYFPLDMKIELSRFDRMVDYFQNHRYAAKQYYGEIVLKELRRLSKIVTSKVEELFPD